MRRPLLLLTVLLLLASRAAPAQELVGTTRQVALSNATHAFANGTAALYSNPAGMALVYQYMIEANYQYWQRPNDHQTTVAVVDSATNHAFALGGAYTFHRGQWGGSNGDRGDVHNVQVGAASGFQAGSVGLFLGGEYKYLNASQAISDATFGGIVSIAQMVNIGVVGHNLFNPHPAVNPRALTTGVSVGQDSFIVAFDTTFDFDTRPDGMSMIYAVGTEYFIAGVAGLRAGYRFDRAAGGRHSISAGVGYIYRVAGVEVGYEQNPKDGKDNRFVGSVVFFIP